MIRASVGVGVTAAAAAVDDVTAFVSIYAKCVVFKKKKESIGSYSKCKWHNAQIQWDDVGRAIYALIYVRMMCICAE